MSNVTGNVTGTETENQEEKLGETMTEVERDLQMVDEMARNYAQKCIREMKATSFGRRKYTSHAERINDYWIGLLYLALNDYKGLPQTDEICKELGSLVASGEIAHLDNYVGDYHHVVGIITDLREDLGNLQKRIDIFEKLLALMPPPPITEEGAA